MGRLSDAVAKRKTSDRRLIWYIRVSQPHRLNSLTQTYELNE